MSGTNARLSIGEFSRLTWLSPKALRLYERRGLLMPYVVDEYTGYRYYRSSQAKRARMIALLRRVGMPLERIGTILDATVDEQRELLDAYRIDVVRAHERAVALIDSLAGGLFEDRPASAEDAPGVSSRDVPAQPFVSWAVRTTAADLPFHIERATAELSQRAGAAIDRSRPLVVVYHGEVSWESDGPIEVRVPVTGESSADGVEPAGSELFVDVPYGEVQFPTILRAFDAVRDAATHPTRRPSGSPREIYLDGDPFRCQVAQRYVETQS
ncbi:MerR family transcriptional regulator [Nocardiopsis sp. FR6]|uniref:MerR family transcriptional regulator n=1 Tax=Nocardiopsis sp. FR6 TaxID=2605986 RepID=UPI00135C51EA|nr:MerR family transcriptional regulator [Nocardiopsis sp. FR6]